MTGIDTLGLEGYKCFDQLRIPLKSLTLLTGFNAAGKSSALQPLLLLAQASRSKVWGVGQLDSQIPLNGELVRLGSAGDVLQAGTANQTRFYLSYANTQIDLHITARAGERVLHVSATNPGRDQSEIIERLGRLMHISAVRGGPSEAFPIPDVTDIQAADVGTDGRFASYLYHELADTDVEQERCLPGSAGVTFRRQVDAWLDYLAPGANVNVQAISVASMLALQFRLSQIGEWRRPANVGYGLTYVFPILVALLAARSGDIVVIDSPEAHLHPQAQSRMGRLLATFAAAGLQILVETHSDHILNGARLAVRDRIISTQDVQLLFFAGVSPGNHGVTSPRMDEDGRIDEWPDGFFDQGDKDVSNLAGWS